MFSLGLSRFEFQQPSRLGFILRCAFIELGCSLLQSCAPAGDSRASLADRGAAVGQSVVDWASPLDRDHPLAGRIWDIARARFVDEAVLGEEVRHARFVGIGEQHDNVDHHRLEARLLAAVTATRHPDVVFEMIDEDAQSAVDVAQATHPGDADAIGDAVDWSHSGWPAWSTYRPVFAVAASRRLRVVGGGLTRAQAHRIALGGVAALAPELVHRFGLEAPLDAVTARALREEMRDAHCGMLPDSMLDAMALIQRARDATLAERLAAKNDPDGAVLVAGNGHVRNDRGVPSVLALGTHASMLAVGLVEVHHQWTEPEQYAAAFAACPLPFDYVWFTPRTSDVDHCDELRRKR
jgi:uncharacterized iron-regulated protein